MHLSLRAAIVACLLAGGLSQLAVAPQPAEAGGRFVWPAEGRITQRYGCTGFSWEPRRGSCAHFHSGIDIADRAGTPIRAANAGVVKLVGWNPYDRPGQRAWVVVIKHDAGFTGWYAHMQAKYAPGVRAGRRVRAGQVIGYMGSTGRSTGVHLHFSFMRNGSPINPLRYLPGRRKASRSETAGRAPDEKRTKRVRAVAPDLIAGTSPPPPPGRNENPAVEFASLVVAQIA